jgi:uncharacterized protein (TIGR03437 family)
VSVAAAAPALFTVSGGAGQAVALNQDGGLNSSANPAPRGSIVVLFGTGEGPAGAQAISVIIGGAAADVLWAGPAPGLPGVFQINTRLPGAFTPAGALPVVLRSATAVSPEGVTVWVK